LQAFDGGVEMRIVDDGVGFVAGERARIGLGLRSIDERVRFVGGTVQLESRPGQGTSLLVRVPLEGPSRPRVAPLPYEH
jgi:signal transduction histidine kinase